MENTNRLILAKISSNEMLLKLSSKEENIKITSLLCSLPFISQLAFDIGHALLQNVIETMIVSDIKKEEELSSSNHYLYFLIKGEIFTKNVQYREFSDTVDGPLNILNKNNITNIDKNIVPITITAVAESILLQISIDEIKKAKRIIKERDINYFKYSDLLMKYLTRLQIEKMNKYMTRRIYRRNEFVYREGEIPNEIVLIKKGSFRLTKKREIHTDTATKLNIINNELKILSKESDIYNYCINGNYSLKAKYVRGLSKQLENEKTSIPMPISNVEEVIINVRVIYIII